MKDRIIIIITINCNGLILLHLDGNEKTHPKRKCTMHEDFNPSMHPYISHPSISNYSNRTYYTFNIHKQPNNLKYASQSIICWTIIDIISCELDILLEMKWWEMSIDTLYTYRTFIVHRISGGWTQAPLRSGSCPQALPYAYFRSQRCCCKVPFLVLLEEAPQGQEGCWWDRFR